MGPDLKVPLPRHGSNRHHQHPRCVSVKALLACQCPLCYFPHIRLPFMPYGFMPRSMDTPLCLPFDFLIPWRPSSLVFFPLAVLAPHTGHRAHLANPQGTGATQPLCDPLPSLPAHSPAITSSTFTPRAIASPEASGHPLQCTETGPWVLLAPGTVVTVPFP